MTRMPRRVRCRLRCVVLWASFRLVSAPAVAADGLAAVGCHLGFPAHATRKVSRTAAGIGSATQGFADLPVCTRVLLCSDTHQA